MEENFKEQYNDNVTNNITAGTEVNYPNELDLDQIMNWKEEPIKEELDKSYCIETSLETEKDFFEANNKNKVDINIQYSHFFEFEEVSFKKLRKELEVRVVDYVKLTENDLLSTSYYVYQIECSTYKSKVYRRYNDFLWLREILEKYYPGILIPPIPPKDALGKHMVKDFHMRRVRDFNKFFNHISKQKVLSHSTILTTFLTEINSHDFLRKKNNFSNYKPDSSSFIKKNDDSIINEENTKNNEDLITHIKQISIQSGNILNELKSEFKKLHNDFKTVSQRLVNISQISKQIYTNNLNYPEILQNDYETKYYAKLRDFSSEWAKTYQHQIELIKDHFEENYDFQAREYGCFEEMVNNYFYSKKELIDYEKNINEKKEKCFKLKNFDKWDLSTDDFINRENLIHNKEECFRKMLKTETRVLIGMEEKQFFMNHQIIKEFTKLRKYLNVLQNKQDDQMALNNKVLLGDIFSIIRLATMSIV